MNGREIIDAYLDGGGTDDGLRHWLAENPDHLRQFTAALVFENDLRLAAEAELKPIAVTPFQPPAPATAPAFRRHLVSAAAAAVLIACLFLLFVRIARPSAVVTVGEVSGALSWTGPDGESRTIPASGSEFRPGTFETTGENSHATLVFRDGTRVDLRGDSRASVSDRDQKQIHLQHGWIRAAVRPQAPGKPLLVKTPTALLEVLGTVFSVNAGSARTTMNVEQGRVKFSRLADGGSVVVPASHSAAASFESATPLIAVAAANPPDSWQWKADHPLPSADRGEWTPPSAASPGFVSSIPIVVGTDAATGRPLVQHGINLREETSGTRGAFVTVSPDSVLTFRYLAAKPSEIVVFLSTRRSDGDFGGNFEFKLPANSGTSVGGGWREITLPLRDAPPLHREIAATPSGNGIATLGIRSYRQQARLRFSAISVSPR